MWKNKNGTRKRTKNPQLNILQIKVLVADFIEIFREKCSAALLRLQCDNEVPP